MAKNTYEGPALDGSYNHISERDRDFEDIEETTDVPQEALENGELTSGFGFVEDDDLTKKEKVKKLYQKRQYTDYKALYGDISVLGVDVTKTYINKIFKNLQEEEENLQEEKEENQEIEDLRTEIKEDIEDLAKGTKEEFEKLQNRQNQEIEDLRTEIKDELNLISDIEAVENEKIPVKEVETRILEPLRLAKEFSDREERQALEAVEEQIIKVLRDHRTGHIETQTTPEDISPQEGQQ
jgi:DNA repair exonuclease SbcCD ATPase subunit